MTEPKIKTKTKRGLPALTEAERAKLDKLRLAAFSAALDYARKGFANMSAVSHGEREELFKAAEFLHIIERNVNSKSAGRHAV